MQDDCFVITDGRRRRRVIRPWAKLPAGMEFGPVSRLAVTPDGKVIVVQRTDPAVLIFGPEGDLQNCWHHPRLTSVHGICTAGGNDFWVTTYDAHQVIHFDISGRLIQELGNFNSPRWREPFNHPTGVACGPEGDLYVSDGYGNARIHRFDARGRHLTSWGEPGDGPGGFSTPHSLLLLDDGRVLVVDRDNDRIQIFTDKGVFIEEWCGLCRPMDAWSDGETIYVTEQTPRLTVFDRSGKIIGRARTFSVYPHGIAGEKNGSLFLAEQLPSGVAKLEPIRPAQPPPASWRPRSGGGCVR